MVLRTLIGHFYAGFWSGSPKAPKKVTKPCQKPNNVDGSCLWPGKYGAGRGSSCRFIPFGAPQLQTSKPKGTTWWFILPTDFW